MGAAELGLRVGPHPRWGGEDEAGVGAANPIGTQRGHGPCGTTPGIGACARRGSAALNRGRAPRSLELVLDAGLVYAAELGATRLEVGLANLSGELLASEEMPIDVKEGAVSRGHCNSRCSESTS